MGNAASRDRALVSQVLAGDEPAAAALVERLRPIVAAIVRRRLPLRTGEADLIQTVFLKVFTKLDQYSGRVPLEHWVSRIAINACLSELRRERSRPELRRADLSEEQQAVLEFLDESPAEVWPDQEMAARELVQKMLERLPPREHLVITMLHLEGCTHQEIHASSGWSILAIKLLAFRARRRMKKALKKLLQTNLT